MKNTLAWIAAGLLSAPALLPSADAPLDLKALYRAAEARSESLGMAEAGRRGAEALARQSLAVKLPQLSLKASETLAEGGPTDLQSPGTRFNLKEDLWTGLDLPAALKASPALKAQAEALRDAAAQALYADLGAAYLNVLGLQGQVDSENAALDNAKASVEDLRRRVGLGRNRRAELSSAEAQVARVQAVLASLDGRLAEAREALASLCGLDADTALAPPDGGDAPGPLETYEKAAESKPVVRAAREAVTLAEASRQAVLGGFLPSLGAEGNWYLARQNGASGPAWDAALSLNLPLFQSGAQKARLDAADAALDSAKLALAQAQRLALTEARQAWQAEGKARARREAADGALSAAEKSADDQRRDFNNSLITSLDLLRAQDAVESARLDALQARWDLERARLRLRLAGGALRP